jgi:RimJ/RimL family protein N-acetyltransferase
MKTIILKGKKVILRPAKLSDAPRFVKWFNDRSVNKFLLVRKLNLQEERVWIKNVQKAKDACHLAIDTVEGVHIGAAVFARISSRNHFASFGITIGDKHYWGRGYGREAARLMLDYGFKKLKLHRVGLDVYAYNPRALKLYRRLGFRKEGVKREHNYYGGKYHDTLSMGLLAPEWQKAPAKLKNA